MENGVRSSKILSSNVIVAALGYFVDIYDLLLFGIVRTKSLIAIGVPEDKLLEEGVFLINAQMVGMLLGGILWGVLGDKRGRISVLFGSILMYSLANIANAFVTDVTMYGVLRFVAGIGLAGELGAGITLVAETLSKENRGWGTTIVASIGILGAVAAAIVGDFFDWKTAYIIGGVMGLALLFLRVSMFESGMFAHAKESSVAKGDLKMLFVPYARFAKFVKCILIGLPVWFVVGILFTFASELAKALEITGAIENGKAIMFGYIGLSMGDLGSGFLSQVMRSRRKSVGLFLSIMVVGTCGYYLAHGITPTMFYALCVFLGFGAGYWAVFMTIAAEQFGTNLRATVTTTVPNFVRGAVVPLTLGFQAFNGSLGLLNSAMVMGVISFGLAFIAVFTMEETFDKDLDYFESH